MNSTVRHSLLCIILLSSCLLIGCGGCASVDTQTESATNPEKRAPVPPSEPPLSSQTIFTYLVFNHALLKDDVRLLVQSLDKLTAFNPPATVYIDAGIWALENSARPLLPLLKTGLEAHEDSIPLNLLYAEILQKTGDTPAAISHMQNFIKAYPDVSDAKVELSILFAHERNFSEAENVLRSIEEKDRTSLVDYYHAKALVGLKRQDEARAYLEASIKKDPEFIEALNDLAFLYERNKDFRKARDTYQSILDTYGTNPELVVRVILLSLRLKETEKALELFENSPMTPELTITVASMFVDAELYDMAEPILLGLADMEDAPQDLYFYLAAIAFERDRDAQKAYDWLTHIDEDHEEFSRSLLLRTKLLMDTGNFPQALEETRLGKEIDADNMQFWTTEVAILGSQGQFDEALYLLAEIKERWPHEGEVIFLLASVLDQSGDKKNAFKTMEVLLKQEPEHVQALNYVGYTLAEQSKELQRAIALLRKANALSPNSNYILDSLAWALFKAGEREEAWEIIQQAVAAQGEPEATIWEHYGDIARSLGNIEGAHRGYVRALNLSPSNADTIKYKQDQL